MVVRKFIEKIYIVHFWTRAWGSESMPISEFQADTVRGAISSVKTSRGLRKKNITGVQAVKWVQDFDKQGIAIEEAEKPHDTTKCICQKCTGKDDSVPPNEEEGWDNSKGIGSYQ